ncbi:MAG TPA: DUF922 domain-containing protein [Flavobacteriaceae bacterium]|nr:DUF922 domain-containing protein [Flavobacteriaceae bacterium]
MTKYKLHLTSLLLLVSVISFSQDKEEIPWGRPLSWEDFKGEPKTHTHHKATSNMGIKMKYSWKWKNNQLKLKYEVNTVFNPNYSWVKSGKESRELLKHEQIHFDITEIMARKLRKFFSENKFKLNAVRSKIDEVTRILQQENREMQETYDQETNHGNRPKKQAEWRQHIQNELEKLHQYRTPTN